jgi:hypothetical protein
MAKNSSRPLRTIKPSAGTPTVSRATLTRAARSVSTGQYTAKSKSSAGTALSQRSAIKSARGRSREA